MNDVSRISQHIHLSHPLPHINSAVWWHVVMWLTAAYRVNLEAVIGVGVSRARSPLATAAIVRAIVHRSIVAVAWHLVDGQRVSVLAACRASGKLLRLSQEEYTIERLPCAAKKRGWVGWLCALVDCTYWKHSVQQVEVLGQVLNSLNSLVRDVRLRETQPWSLCAH
nr:MAG TPA: hypothetical protein [Caudoviricetes sp.]